MQRATLLSGLAPSVLGLFAVGPERESAPVPLTLFQATSPATLPPVAPHPPTPEQTADAALLSRVAAQDEDAFAELYRKFAPGLFSMVHQIVGDPEAEDVLQESFVQMWRRAATYDSTRSSAFTWAVMISRHKAIDRLRSRQRRERGTENLTAELAQEPQSSDAGSGSVAAALGEDRARVLAALEEIPAEQREAIRLAFFGGLTHAVISDQLETPLGTIKARIRRGLQALQTLLQQR